MRILSTIALLIFSTATLHAAGTPKIGTPNPSVDLGTLFEGETKGDHFILENEGDADLSIMRVHPTCGCTLARILRDDTGEEVVIDKTKPMGIEPLLVLAPGEKARIEITYNSLGQPRRQIVKYVDVFSNDPAQERFRLTLAVRIIRAYQLQPTPIKFGDVRSGSEKELVLHLTPEKGVEFNVTGIIEVPNVKASYETSKTEDGRPTTKIQLRFDGLAPVGSFTRTLAIQTDHPSLSVIKAPMFAEVLPLIDIDTGNPFNSKLVDFGVVPPGHHTKVIEVTSSDPTASFKIVDVTLDSDYKQHLMTRVVTVEEGKHYQIEVSTHPNLDAKFFKGSIVITTDSAVSPETTVYLSGWIKK